MSVNSTLSLASVKIVTWNICANAYVNHIKNDSRHPLKNNDYVTNPGAERYSMVANKIESMNADVVCLQEVENVAFDKIAKYLTNFGYQGYLKM